MKKMLTILTGTMLFLAGCDVRRQDPVAEEKTAGEQKIILAPTTVQMIDSVYNFGTIAEGESVEYSFRFKNTGDNPLLVDNVSASCGCTIPEKPKEAVKPGETGMIKVKFNSENHPNHANKTITVYSNAQPVFPELKLTGDVTPKSKD